MIIFLRFFVWVAVAAAIFFISKTESLWVSILLVALLTMWINHFTNYFNWKRVEEEVKNAEGWKELAGKYKVALGQSVACILQHQLERYFDDSDVTRYVVKTNPEGIWIGCKIGDDDVMVDVDLSFMNEPEKLMKSSGDDLDKAIKTAYCIFMSKKGLDVE